MLADSTSSGTRLVLLQAADEIERQKAIINARATVPAVGLVDRLRRWSHDALVTSPASDLMDEAADEIDRLRRIIMDYAAICQASSREINQLRYSTSATKGGRDVDIDG